MNEAATVPFWREELIQNARILRRMYNVWENDVQAEFELEKALVTGSFFARKMIESESATGDALKQIIEVTEYPRLADDEINWSAERHWYEAYNFMSGTQTKLTGEKICNQVVHSKILSGFGGISGERILAVLVASDYYWKKHVKHIRLLSFIEIFEGVATDSVIELELEFIDTKRIHVNAKA